MNNNSSSEDEEDDDDDASVNNEPSKNLQGNPMPALSVNGDEARCGKFASSSDDKPKVNSKPKRNGRGNKRKQGVAKGRKCKYDRASSNTRRKFFSFATFYCDCLFEMLLHTFDTENELKTPENRHPARFHL